MRDVALDSDERSRTAGADSECESSSELVPVLQALGRTLLPTARSTAGSSRRSVNGDAKGSPATTNTTIEDSESLLRVIETGIIPRLMLAHRSQSARADERIGFDGAAVAARTAPGLSEEDHERFLSLLRFGTEDQLRGALRAHLDRGVPLATVFVELLGRAARRLGELWESDECSFVDVTIGLCRLHAILREESNLFRAADDDGPEFDGSRRRILLTTGGEDQHMLGVVLAAEFFRRAGWHVTCEPGLEAGAVIDLVSRHRYHLLGLSIAHSAGIHTIRAEIDAYRKASLFKPLGVLVGGALFQREPEMVARVEADGVCVDAVEGPRVAQELLERLGLRAGVQN